MTVLDIGPDEREALARLRKLAAARPIDVPAVSARLITKKARATFYKRMLEHSCVLAGSYAITFTLENEGDGRGLERHLSVFIEANSPRTKTGRKGGYDDVPEPDEVWLIAAELGFVGDMEDCRVWPETTMGRLQVNVTQAVVQVEAGHA